MQIFKIKIIGAFLLFFLGITSPAIAQQVAGYSFQKYPALTIYNGAKATINFAGNASAESFKTQITEGYKNSKVNFGGHYITVLSKAGGGFYAGWMVDAKTGLVYDLPLSKENSVRTCTVVNETDITSSKTSNLFVTWNCNDEKIEKEKSIITTKNYTIYLWHDATKKFTLLKEKSVEKKVKVKG